MNYFCYILKGHLPQPYKHNGKVYYHLYYRGYTKNLTRRFQEHKQRKCKSTRRYCGNVIIIYVEIINGKDNDECRRKAMKREKQMKKWSREKIEKLSRTHEVKIREILQTYMHHGFVTHQENWRKQQAANTIMDIRRNMRS